MSRILTVDDEPINLSIMAECLTDEGHQIDEAGDGEDAWALMQKHRYDLVVLDRMMPRLDGMGLLRRIKADPAQRGVPVIMQTAAANPEQVRQGIEAGAYYYLTKPYDPATLLALVRAVLSDLVERGRLSEAGTHLQTGLQLLDSGRFVFRTLDEARALAAALATLCREGSSAGMGLIELLVNAVEHGNLGITYAEKSKLRQNMAWEAEVERRLASADFGSRRASVEFRRDDGHVEFTVRDEGAGFDWKPFLELDPNRAFDLNGRGIAMARMLGFASLAYQGAGNVVVARAERAV